MANKEKRAKRAKAKAKQERLRKQNKKLKVAVNEVKISDDLIEVFKTFPPAFEDFSCIPQARDYVVSRQANAVFDDLAMSVAIIYAMYVYWYTSGSNSIDQLVLARSAEFAVEDEEFKYQMLVSI